MPLDRSVQVELPAHCVRVPKDGKIYIQYVKRAYRNAKGQPTNERVAIGRLDETTGKLIPNRNYYELFGGKAPSSQPELVRSCGNYAVFSRIAKELGVEQLLKKTFPGKAEDILTVAQYMLSEGNVMYYMGDWQEENVTYSQKVLESGDISRLFASIGQAQRLAFFNAWIKKVYSQEYIAYDVTSVSSYSERMESLEWGYNRDKERLRQINLGMYYGEDSGLPLYYRIYPGSITDKTHLKYMTEDTDIIAHERVKFVMDRGFYSTDNLRYLVEKGVRFLIALPNSLKYCRELIEKHRDEIINRFECFLGSGLPYGKAYDVTALGFRMRVHLYYDPVKAVKDSEALQEEIQRQEEELSAMETPPDKKLHFDKYFFINRSKDGKLGFCRNYTAINKALSECGFFLLAETDFKKTTSQVLEIYRRRDVVEKCFDELKNELDMHRLHVQKDETAEGKAFCAFIALIVRSQMQKKLRDMMTENKFTFKKIMLELRKARLIIAPKYPMGCRLMNPPTKIQKEILSCLGLPENTLQAVCYDFART